MIVLATLHVVAIALLWPRGATPAAEGTTAAYSGETFYGGTVRRVTTESCAGTTDTRLANGTVPAVTTCVSAQVRVDGGPDAGRTVVVGVPTELAGTGMAAGAAVRVGRLPPVAGASVTYVLVDYDHTVPLVLLGVLFAALVVAVARWRGLLALVGLGMAFAAIGAFVLPALRHQENPLLVACTAAGSIMMIVLYVAHGVSTKTTTALFGTLAGIWLTGGLGTWATAAAHLTGLTSEDNQTLSRLTTGGGLSNLILAGIVLAGLGVLNDVTITQASAVWEVRRHAPTASARSLFAAGMRIGRDHLASTVYTIAFAYAGVALPTLLLVQVYGEPWQELLNSGQVAEEIVRTLVASIGLVASIPLTTAIAAALAVRTSSQDLPAETAGHGHGHTASGGGAAG